MARAANGPVLGRATEEELPDHWRSF